MLAWLQAPTNHKNDRLAPFILIKIDYFDKASITPIKLGLFQTLSGVYSYTKPTKRIILGPGLKNKQTILLLMCHVELLLDLTCFDLKKASL